MLFLKKTFKIYILTERCNKWVLSNFQYGFEYIEIPSKCIDNFCIIVSVAVGISSEILTDTSCQLFDF